MIGVSVGLATHCGGRGAVGSGGGGINLATLRIDSSMRK